MKNTMNIFAETLAVGGTIYTKSVARITGDKVGAENYAIWKTAMTKAHRAFYEYKKAVDDTIRGKNVDKKSATDRAYTELQAILDLIGEINGFKLEKTQELLDEVAKYAVIEKTMLVGEAFTINTQLQNCKADLKRIGYDDVTGETFKGVNADYAKELLTRKATLEEELAIAKKSSGSGVPIDDLKSFNSFCVDFERKLAKLSNAQFMRSWEEIEAEREAKRAERRAKTAAKKAAKKAAAQAQANAAA